MTMIEQFHRLLLPLLAAFAVACTGANSAATEDGANGVASAHEATGHEDHAGALDGDAMEPATDMGSLHDLDMRWRDQHAAERTLSEVADRPVVMAMVYTSCIHTCPLIMADLKQIEGGLAEDVRDSVRFVLVSLDPERDTPEKLALFATDSRLDPDRWTLLTGDEMDVRMLAAALGVRYRAGAGDDIDHTNAITIVDASGGIVYQQRGVGGGTEAALRAVTALLH